MRMAPRPAPGYLRNSRSTRACCTGRFGLVVSLIVTALAGLALAYKALRVASGQDPNGARPHVAYVAFGGTTASKHADTAAKAMKATGIVTEAPSQEAAPSPSSNIRRSAPGTVRYAPAAGQVGEASAPSPSQSQQAAPSTSRAPAPSRAPGQKRELVTDYSYRATQYKPSPFPSSYKSKLVTRAQQLGMVVPDVFQRHRTAPQMPNAPCPPHDLDGNSVRQPKLPVRPGVTFDQSNSLASPSLEDLGHLTVGFAVSSHNTPKSLQHSMKAWHDSGLLDLFDDKVIMLSVARQEEVDLALSYGFRVYTPHEEERAGIRARHADYLSEFVRCCPENPGVANFPLSRMLHAAEDVAPAPATFVGPAQVALQLELSTDLVMFAEKDFATVSNTTLTDIIKHMLASVAMLSSGTGLVRLRQFRDPNRDGLPNCCAGQCRGSFSNFVYKCRYPAHLDWLALFCDTGGIEGRSFGNIQQCFSEDPAGGLLTDGHVEPDNSTTGATDGDALKAYCFSLDHSGWSNNPYMTRRKWWIEIAGHVGVLSGPDNAAFELNAMLLCDLAPKKGLGSGAEGTKAPHVCVLSPGILQHVEVDG